MTAIQITEINSKYVIRYKEFITKRLIQDENNFRITPSDDLNEPFPMSASLKFVRSKVEKLLLLTYEKIRIGILHNKA